MALFRHHLPLDGATHMVLLGGDPQDVTAEQADGETPGVTFWAEPADTPRRLRVFGWQDFLPAGGAVLIGETRTGDGLRLYLYEMPG